MTLLKMAVSRGFSPAGRHSVMTLDYISSGENSFGVTVFFRKKLRKVEPLQKAHFLPMRPSLQNPWCTSTLGVLLIDQGSG